MQSRFDNTTIGHHRAIRPLSIYFEQAGFSALRISPDCHQLSALAFCPLLAQFASSNFND
jgi:hypothetical protein